MADDRQRVQIRMNKAIIRKLHKHLPTRSDGTFVKDSLSNYIESLIRDDLNERASARSLIQDMLDD